MSFYTFNQNNSGGDFDFNEEYGITHYVIIEADDVRDAESKFRKLIDSYPDRGYDCPCCGDRWDNYLWREAGKQKPSVYDEEVVPGTIYKGRYSNWLKDGYNVAIHYQDGRIVFA